MKDKLIRLGEDVENQREVSVLIPELGNVLITGTVFAGKSVFLKNFVKRVMSSCDDDVKVMVFEGANLNFRFLNKQTHVGHDWLDLSKGLSFLMETLEQRKKDHSASPIYLCVIDEFFDFKNNQDNVSRIEMLMKQGPEFGIQFLISTQAPIFLTETRLDEYAKTKIIFRHFQEDVELLDLPYKVDTASFRPGEGYLISDRGLIHIQTDFKI